jgi:hypothetical protein
MLDSAKCIPDQLKVIFGRWARTTLDAGFFNPHAAANLILSPFCTPQANPKLPIIKQIYLLPKAIGQTQSSRCSHLHTPLQLLSIQATTENTLSDDVRIQLYPQYPHAPEQPSCFFLT